MKHFGGISSEGELLEGLILWRDIAEHHPEQLVELRHYPLVPSPDLTTSAHLYTGHNLCIVRAEEEPQRISEERRPRREVFRDRVAGKPLLPIVERCITFLGGLTS
ncbi:hypothetical protein DEU35_3273 [Microbacterium sp. AG157]|nr:hypothetical protein DEU35_3273 [Microbacterium sp. AG157]